MNTLKELAELAGVSSSYIDKTGQKHDTTDDVRRFFLNAMKIPAATEMDIILSKQYLEKTPLLAETLAFYDNEDIVIPFNGNGSYSLKLIDENNHTLWEKTAENKCEIKIDIPLKHGYYQLQVYQEQELIQDSLLIYAPVMCYQPEFIKNKEHLYGVSLMLYALKSEHGMGIGDFWDLKELVRLTAENGGDAVGINPLGVMSPYMLPSPLFNILKGDVSPYRSLSRLFINYAYLDLKGEPDFQNSSEIQNFISTPEAEAEIKRLKESENVLYAAVLHLKLRLLGMMFEQFLRENNFERQEAFRKYKEEKGDELINLCLFECLLEAHRGEQFWRFWHDGTEDINSSATRSFYDNNRKRVDFFAYCHWLGDIEVKSVQKLAKDLGMKIGLYADMPIGAASNGAEVWENKEAYVLETGVGAPADPMRPRGQSWGFTPYHPLELNKQHYAPFIRLARESMSYAGALRIDHAMGLRRLFWVYFTANIPVVQGAYVYYDIKALTSILAIESNRAKCLLIGEDLGTVPEGFREYMAEHGLLSYKVFFRQKNKDGSFIAPKEYMYMSLAQSSTHDQATSRGFWANEDIEVFKGCGLYVNYEQYQSNLDTRRKDRENMIKAFNNEDILPKELEQEMEASAEKGEKIPEGLGDSVNAYGAKTNSALYFVRLCDIYKQKKLDNAPGTIDEYPNWRLKLTKPVEEIAISPEFRKTLAEIKKYRP